ncbi:MAG: Fic family protein [Clostridia bacterium]
MHSQEFEEPTYLEIDNASTSPDTRETNWNTAIGLNAIDGLNPSEHLLKLKDMSIKGEKTYNEIHKDLSKYYAKKDLSEKEVKENFECDFVSTRIAELLEDQTFVFSPIYLLEIHSKLFTGIFTSKYKSYIGKFRDYNITKNEKPVIYGNYRNLLDYLKYYFENEKSTDYLILSKEQQIEKISSFTSSIWRIHPFHEGNIITVAVFIIKYLNAYGWNINDVAFQNNSKYFRDALILSNFFERKNNTKSNNKYLLIFFKKLLFNENINLSYR